MQSTLDEAAAVRVREHIRYYSCLGREAVDRRLEELDREWDLERTVTAGLSGLGAFGLVIGLLGGRSFRLFTWLAVPALFSFSLGRWSPPALLKDGLGIRPRRAIEEERYALKALRGDFEDLGRFRPSNEAADALERQTSQVMSAVQR